jgi:hypothetical protein
MGVSHLVRGNAVDKCKKRPALVAVTGQCRQHRETHLLSDIIRRSERLFLTTNTSTAIPHHQRTDPAEHTLNGLSLTINGSTDQDVEIVCYSGHRRMQPCRYDERPAGLHADRR